MEAQPIVYTPHGVCCSRISYESREGRLSNVRFEGGCNGKGLARLLEGMPAAEEKTPERHYL